MTPRVSVVTPLFNCLPLTQAMLATLRATMPVSVPYEVIFVDDGSTDGTRAWLSDLRDPAIRVVLNERNLGYAASNNRGTAIARGELLALLNNDLELTPRWIEPILAVIERLGPRAGAIGNLQTAVKTGELDHAGIVVNLKAKPEHLRVWPRFPRLRPFRRTFAVTGACLFIRRSLWAELGGFDEQFVNGCEDVDLCLRAAARGGINGVATQSVIRHHVSSSPGRKQRDEQNTQRLTVKWRDALIDAAARAWSRDFLQRQWTTARAPEALADTVSVFAHAYGLRRTPPALTRAGMENAVGIELRRWRKLGLAPDAR